MFSPSGRFGASGPKVAILWFALVALAALSLLVPASLAAGPTGAPGNNGTVKVHDGGAEPSPEVRNQPHVCTFHLHFFFADAAQSGSWQIRSWSPTGDGSVVLAGTYTTDANGEYRTPPAPDAYTLPNGHYKVFWEGRNSQNIKHKVFWVDCPAGAAQGSGSQETAAKANAHAGASFGAALKAEIAAELSTLEAMAGTDTSLRAEIGSEQAMLAVSTSTQLAAGVNSAIAAQNATRTALANASGALQAQVAAQRASVAAGTTAQFHAALTAQVQTEQASAAVFAQVVSSLQAQIQAEQAAASVSTSLSINGSAQLAGAMQAQLVAEAGTIEALGQAKAMLEAQVHAGQAAIAASTSARMKAALRGEVAAIRAATRSFVGLATNLSAQAQATQTASAIAATITAGATANAGTGGAGNGATGGAGNTGQGLSGQGGTGSVLGMTGSQAETTAGGGGATPTPPNTATLERAAPTGDSPSPTMPFVVVLLLIGSIGAVASWSLIARRRR